eukprot:1150286-Pelagomonas_calceolata.AAC.6
MQNTEFGSPAAVHSTAVQQELWTESEKRCRQGKKHGLICLQAAALYRETTSEKHERQALVRGKKQSIYFSQETLHTHCSLRCLASKAFCSACSALLQ